MTKQIQINCYCKNLVVLCPLKKKKNITKMQSMSKVQMHLNQWVRQYKKTQYLALHLHRKQEAVMVKNFFLCPNELWLSLTPNRIEKRA